jgi:hypothetical protein
VKTAIAFLLVLVSATVRADALSEQFATKLANATGALAKSDTVNVRDHVLQLAATVEQVKTAPDGRVVAGVKVTCTLDGKPIDALTSAGVGIDASRDAAIATAATEWAMQYGKPIVDALFARSPALTSGGFAVYAGPAGIRGDKPDGLGDFNASFFHTIEPALAKLIPAKTGVHAITVLGARSADGAIDGEFRVDGEVSDALKQLALQLKWPTRTTYMLKQYYVLIAH